MPDGLYERDALAWAERQAGLLRRLAAGERLDEAVDWAHVIEEVADVGLSELQSCRSLLRQAMVRLLRLRVWPDSPAAAQWREEMLGFLDDAQDRFTPSMRQRVDVGELYRAALRRVWSEAEGAREVLALPEVCPFRLEELVSGAVEVGELLCRLGGG
jgi:hypothetical protein